MYLEVNQFGNPQSGGIQGGQHGAVAEVSGCFQQRFDLLLAQDDRKLLLVPGQGNAFDGNLPVQRMGVEKPKSGDDLDVGGQGCALLLAQKQLVLTDVLRAKLVWRLPEMFGESGDAAQVGGDGVGCVVANLEILQHPLS